MVDTNHFAIHNCARCVLHCYELAFIYHDLLTTFQFYFNTLIIQDYLGRAVQQ